MKSDYSRPIISLRKTQPPLLNPNRTVVEGQICFDNFYEYLGLGISRTDPFSNENSFTLVS